MPKITKVDCQYIDTVIAIIPLIRTFIRHNKAYFFAVFIGQ